MTRRISNAGVQRAKRGLTIAIVAAAVIGILTVGWFWIGGESERKAGPRVTVGNYMAAMRDKNVNAAQDLLCSGLKTNNQDVAERAKRFRRLDYRVGHSEKKSETEYQVDVAVNSVVNLDGQDTPSNTTYVFKVVKEHGNWLVCGITT